MVPTNCGCTLSAIQVLMQVEQLEGKIVGLETSLEMIGEAEMRCLAVLNCATCRQRRFSMASITVVCATVTKWVRGVWLQQDMNNDVSLGNINLDRADAEMISRELKSLQLSHFIKVMTQLNSALCNARSVQMAECVDIVRAEVQQLQDCKQQVKGLSVSGQ